MTKSKFTYRPRNNMVVCQRVPRGETASGISVPTESAEGHRWYVVAIGPQVEDLEIGDEVLVGGVPGTHYGQIPTEKHLWMVNEVNCLAVVGKDET
jgi:hypothetical protein